MQYTQKLKKIGNSVGIIIPSQLLEKLNIGVGTQIFIEEIQDKLLIKKEQSNNISPQFLRIAESLADRYQTAFKKLAES